MTVNNSVAAAGFNKSNDNNIPINNDNINTIKTLLNNKGCGFCLAKWKQVTLHLGTGQLHSCHHPVPHTIPLSELKNNPMALTNTNALKESRRQMLNNEKPSECDYCWRIEDNNHTSDRYLKSLEPWALEDYDSISNLTGSEDVFPTYLEVDFGNTCNLKCIYCGPEYSSKWVEDLKNNGPYKLHEGTSDESWVQGWQNLDSLNYKTREINPYADAFWKWFPDAYKHLKHYRITGGEPLLNKETYRSLEWFLDNPNPEIEIGINSNLSVPDKLWDKFISLISQLVPGIHIKKITLYTSVEAWNERAEYIRTGLDFALFQRRYIQLLDMGNIRCTIMAAYNILSITSFQNLIQWLYKLKRKYNSNDSLMLAEYETGFNLLPGGDNALSRRTKNPTVVAAVGIDIPYLRQPSILDVQYSTHDLVDDFLIPQMLWMAEHTIVGSWAAHQGFEEYETDKLKRIVMHRLQFNSKNNPTTDMSHNIKIARSGFYEYINQTDNRNNSDFLSTFPEMQNFYNICEKDNKDIC